MKLICLAFISLLSLAFAEDITVEFVKGDVKLTDMDGFTRELKEKESVIEGEAIHTGNEALVILKIGKHSVHKIEENSEVIVEALPYKYENSEELEQGGSFFLRSGAVLSEIFKSSDSESFQVRTANTSMGVRGTKFLSQIDQGNLLLTVKEGVVEVENDGQKDIVEKGQEILIEGDKSFTALERREWSEKLDWKATTHRSTGLSELKEKMRDEFKKKKRKWQRDEKKWQSFLEKREKKKQAYLARVQNLKNNEKLKKRKERLKDWKIDKIKKSDFKGKQFRDTLLKQGDKKPNEFLEKRKELRRSMREKKRSDSELKKKLKKKREELRNQMREKHRQQRSTGP